MKYSPLILLLFIQCSTEWRPSIDERLNLANNWSTYTTERLSDLKGDSPLEAARTDVLLLDYSSALEKSKALIVSLPSHEKIIAQLLAAQVHLLLNNDDSHFLKLCTTIDSTMQVQQYVQPLRAELLYLKAKYHKDKNELTLALSCIHLGLQELTNYIPSEDTKLMKAKLLFLKAALLVNERSGYDDVMNHCFETGKNLIDKNQYPINCGLSILNNYYRLKDSLPSKAAMLLEEINTFEQPLPPFLALYKNLNFGFNAWDGSSNREVINYFQTALSYVGQHDCNRMKLALYSYLAEVYLTVNVDSSEFYVTKFDDFDSCSSNFKKTADLYKSELKYLILKQRSNSNPNKILSILIERRSLMEELFSDKSALHLGNFYSFNAARICNHIIENKIEPETTAVIREIFNDTKFKHQRLQDYSADAEEENIQLSGLLKEINDFKDTTGIRSSAYQAIYELLTIDKLSPKVVQPSTSELSTESVVQYFKFEKQYYCYFYTDNNLQLHKIEEQDIIGYARYQSRCNDQRTPFDSDTLKYYARKILPFPTKALHRLAIIPDGLLEHISFDLLINDQDSAALIFQMPYDQKQPDSSFVDKRRASFFSFSDKKSINDSAIKLVPELYYGHQECTELAAIFEGQLYEGSAFNYKNFSANTDQSLIHLSTHSFNNKEERFDNFFLLRQAEGLDSIFISDLMQLNCQAQFVSLASCETNIGQHLDGNGTYSLSKTLINSGVSSVLKTLWKVDDQATKAFMLEFYKNWLTGISVIEALQKAKTHMQNSSNYGHPYFWAGFVIEGQAELYLKG